MRSELSAVDTGGFNSVVGQIGYLGEVWGRPKYRIYPPSSGRKSENPPREYHEVRFYDCRPALGQLDLDRDGFVVRTHVSATQNLYDDEFVREHYYPEIQALVKETTGALEVLAFDHNVRSANAARQVQAAIQAPVDAAHVDYSDRSGQRRVQQLLEAHGKSHLSQHRAALINVWRPLTGPVQDKPLALCHPRSVSPGDFVETDIDHYGGDDLSQPRHSGQIYSLRYSPEHRWFYVADMWPNETLVFKCYDSLGDGTAPFTPDTAFANPDCPPAFVPRESIEVRTVVIY